MNATEPLALGLMAIFAMAAMNYLMRAGGFWLMAHVPLTVRVRRMLAALPGSIVLATVLPIVAKSGPTAFVALAAAAACMLLVSNEFLAVVAGVLAAALIRSAGI